MITIIGFALFFVIGCLVGMVVENDNNKQKQMRRAKSRHPVNIGRTIEEQMARDGWKI